MVDVYGGEFGIDPSTCPSAGTLCSPAAGARSSASSPVPSRRRRSCCCTGGPRRPTSTGSSCYGGLAEHFNVVALDHRGHGRGLRSDGPFRLTDCADDVAALVDVLDLGPVIAVGYSMGGPIAQLLWQRHRDVCRRPRAVRDELHVRWHGSRNDPVPRRRRHRRCGGTRCRWPHSPAPPSAPSAGGGRSVASRGGGSPRSPVTTGCRSSKPDASSVASTHARGSKQSTCPPLSSSPITTTSSRCTANSTSPAASPTPRCTASPAATPCARSTREPFSPPWSTPATPSRGSPSPLPRDGQIVGGHGNTAAGTG